MDFDATQNRPSEEAREKYWQTYDREKGEMMEPAFFADCTLLDVQKKEIDCHGKNGGVYKKEMWTLTVLLPSQKYIDIPVWGAIIKDDGSRGQSSPQFWDFCYLAHKQKAGCLGAESEYTDSNGYTHTRLPDAAGLKFDVIVGRTGTTKSGYPQIEGMVYEAGSHLSAKEAKAELTTAEQIKTDLAALKAKHEEWKKSGNMGFAPQASFGGQQQRPQTRATAPAAVAPAAPAEPAPFVPDDIPF